VVCDEGKMKYNTPFFTLNGEDGVMIVWGDKHDFLSTDKHADESK